MHIQRRTVKFVAAGCAGNVVYAVVFLALARLGAAEIAGNVAATVVSTLVVNEAHRVWTFAGQQRPSVVVAHTSGAASAVTGLTLTSGSLGLWHWLSPGASDISSIVIAWCVTAAVGMANYLVLRRAAPR